MIKKVSGGYQVVSSKGKNLGGPYKTLDAAKKRLRQVEFQTPQRIATGRSTAMRVLHNRTRTMSKPTRRANWRSARTPVRTVGRGKICAGTRLRNLAQLANGRELPLNSFLPAWARDSSIPALPAAANVNSTLILSASRAGWCLHQGAF
jgi:hypothetical protein